MLRSLLPRRLWPASCAVAAATAFAQAPALPSPASAAADPLDAATPVPPVVHRPLIRTRPPVGDADPLPWRQANETVGRIGGWRAYAREIAAAAAGTPAGAGTVGTAEAAGSAATAPAAPGARSVTPAGDGAGAKR